jgi:predicted metal-dependent hydrolase
VKIIRSRRRSVALIVTDDAQLIVRAPLRLPQVEIELIVAQKRSWIERQLAEISSRPKAQPISTEERRQLKQEAAVILRERAAYLAKQTGYLPAAVKISGARQRWGSCGPKGTINLSWRLVRAPQVVLDYVIIHELVHLAERNHSRRFWDKVALIVPDHRQHRRWLRQNGNLLPA